MRKFCGGVNTEVPLHLLQQPLHRVGRAVALPRPALHLTPHDGFLVCTADLNPTCPLILPSQAAQNL